MVEVVATVQPEDELASGVEGNGATRVPTHAWSTDAARIVRPRRRAWELRDTDRRLLRDGPSRQGTSEERRLGRCSTDAQCGGEAPPPRRSERRRGDRS